MSELQILRITVSLSTGEYEATFKIPAVVALKNQFAILNLARAMLDEALAVIKARPGLTVETDVETDCEVLEESVAK